MESILRPSNLNRPKPNPSKFDRRGPIVCGTVDSSFLGLNFRLIGPHKLQQLTTTVGAVPSKLHSSLRRAAMAHRGACQRIPGRSLRKAPYDSETL